MAASFAKVLCSALLLGGVGLPSAACSLVVDTEELQRGDEGLSCTVEEKVCPDRELPGRGACVSKTNPSYGCGAEACSACALANAAARCANNVQCAIATCQGDHFDCNDMVDDGCEIDLGRDEKNCGSCDNECRAANGATSCSNGQCLIVYCSEPFDNCDGKYSTGCETDLRTSKLHCGACKAPCDGTCSDGVCNP